MRAVRERFATRLGLFPVVLVASDDWLSDEERRIRMPCHCVGSWKVGFSGCTAWVKAQGRGKKAVVDAAGIRKKQNPRYCCDIFTVPHMLVLSPRVQHCTCAITAHFVVLVLLASVVQSVNTHRSDV